jgi:thiol:disulfide interchange protein DsbD
MTPLRFEPRHFRLGLLALLGFAGAAAASPWWLRGAAGAEQDILPPDVAFHLSAGLDGDLVQLRWVIADGYFLYRNKIQVRAESPDLVVGSVSLPPGTRFEDKNFGVQDVYFQQVTASVPFTRSDYGAHPLQLAVTYQGCAQSGFCYPPISKVVFPDNGARSANRLLGSGLYGPPDAGNGAWVPAAIAGGLAAFLFAGLVQRRRRRLPASPA